MGEGRGLSFGCWSISVGESSGPWRSVSAAAHSPRLVYSSAEGDGRGTYDTGGRTASLGKYYRAAFEMFLVSEESKDKALGCTPK